MPANLVILTGASGSGKTTLAHAVESRITASSRVCFFDSIGVPSPTTMAGLNDGTHEPGGAWQRAMTHQWFDRITHDLDAGISVLFEGQMRLAFIQEALQRARIESAHLILVDCDDATRFNRLTHDRAQPDLANEHMLHWASYLRGEANSLGCEILDTGTTPFAACVDRILRALNT